MGSINYIRKFGTSEFIKADRPLDADSLLVLRSSRREEPYLFFCREHRCFERAEVLEDGILTECGNKVSGIPVEYPVKPSQKAEEIEKIRNKLQEKKVRLRGRRKLPAEFLFNYYYDSVYIENLEEEINNFTDERGVFKDIVAYSLTAIEKTSSIVVRFFRFDRKYMDSFFYESKNQPILNQYEIYCSIGGSLRIPSRENKNNNERYWWSERTKRNEDFAFDVKFSEEAMKEIHSVLNAYAGREVTLNTILNGENLLEALHNFPYEPNIQLLVDFEEAQKQAARLYENHIEYNLDPNVYNIFCESFKIKSCTSLRKEFYKNPICLLVYSVFSNAGFTDKNILLKIASEKQNERFLSLPKMPLLFFIQFVLTQKNQVSACNYLKKIISSDCYEKKTTHTVHMDTELEDFLNMFMEYYNYIPDAIKKSILKEGVTTNTHNLLSKVSWNVQNQNVPFIYTKEQLLLEDDIDGYTFTLPKDSDTLFDIGSNLHNCVASYRRSVLSGQCIIVFAKKEVEYRLCIELRGNKVWQRRADYNTKPEGDDLAVLEKWQSAHNLIVEEYLW